MKPLIEKCPCCGTQCEVKWYGLELVAESGDETLASKSYKPVEVSDNDMIKLYMKRYPNLMMNGFSGRDLRQAYFNGIKDILEFLKQER